MEGDIIARENIPYQAIPAAGLHGVGMDALPGNIIRLIQGYFASRRILKQFNPDVLLFTGGYVAVPMAMAGIKYQSLLFVPDIEPGQALKAIAHFADHIAVTAPDSNQYFSGKPITVTGYPTRPDLQRWTRETGRQFLNIHSDKPVVLVFGGSKGARSINQAILNNLGELLSLAEIIHISGSLDWEMVQSAREMLSEQEKSTYHILPYLHEMGAALAAADMAVSRSGASTLGEYPLFGLPAILVPYPYAWRYQKINADYLARYGAAYVIENSSLNRELLPTLKRLLQSPEELSVMKKAAKQLASPTAAQSIATLLTDLVPSARQTGRAHD
jgi:UDP-N-acetylglucosamine--N-acetylmuramyl-(pentapeptide) pyrophosphoryl-undecaprenol N-acetylglucosamine transferase